MRYNLYIGNHGKRHGIEDFITIVSEIFARRHLPLEVSEILQPDAVNLVIDEFTNYMENEQLRTFRASHPDTPLILIVTEFVTQTRGIRTLNFYEGWLAASSIAILNIIIRNRREDYLRPTCRDWIVAALYLPVFTLLLTQYSAMRLLGKTRHSLGGHVYRYAYLLMRYLGLEANLPYFDAIILSHPSIGQTMKGIKHPPILGTLYPEIDEVTISHSLLENKKLHIEMTGTITRYRHRFFRIINAKLLELGLHHRFQLCRAHSFSDKEALDHRGAFSLHPPQQKNWAYSSPTRIYRAIAIDHNIPISTQIFGQHPIEDLTLLLNSKDLPGFIKQAYAMYKNPQRTRQEMLEKVHRYNAIAIAENDKIFLQLQQKQTRPA